MGSGCKDIEDSLLRACDLQRRHRCGSNEGRGCCRVAYADECSGSAMLCGLRRILSTVRRGFFEDSKSDYRIAKEEKKNYVDREMCGIILKAQGTIDHNANTKSP